MDANDLIGLAQKSRYLRAVDVDESFKVTIANVTVETMKAKGEDERERGVVWFHEDERGLVVNVSLGQILRAMFGVDLDNWNGKRIELYNDTSVRGKSGKAVGGIRIKSSPDIDSDVVVLAGQSPFSKGTEYTVKAASSASSGRRNDGDTESISNSPLSAALRKVGLSVSDFDAWAMSVDKPRFHQLHEAGRAAAAKWVSGNGHKVIGDFIYRQYEDSDPMAV
jgi:hypothetical protein